MPTSPEEFIRTWQHANNIYEVMEKLNLVRSAVSSRASFYRKNGVPLKRFPKSVGRKANDWQRLAKLAKKELRESQTDGEVG